VLDAAYAYRQVPDLDAPYHLIVLLMGADSDTIAAAASAVKSPVSVSALISGSFVATARSEAQESLYRYELGWVSIGIRLFKGLIISNVVGLRV